MLWKKSSEGPRMSYGEAVEEALCFGWIDSKPAQLDEHRSLLWMSPRKAGSAWSRLNKTRVEQAIAAGRMHESGLAKVVAAQADGSWTALDRIEAMEMPDDLIAALTSVPPAAVNFERFPPSVKRGILHWIACAKTAGTREKRVAETARLAAINERANQWRKAESSRSDRAASEPSS